MIQTAKTDLIQQTEFGNTLVLKQQDIFIQNFVNHVEKLLISEPESFCIFSKNLLLMSSFSIEQKHIFLGHEELSKNLGDKFSHTRSRQFFPLPSVYVSISGCADKGFMPLSNEQTEKD